MLKKTYLVIGVLVLMMYGASGLLGWEMRSTGRKKIDPKAQKAAGGVRALPVYFWYHRGGK